MVPVSMYCKLDSFGRILKHAVDNLDDQQLLLQHLCGTRYQVPGSWATPNAMPVTYSCCQTLTLIVMSGVSMHLLPPCTLPLNVWYQSARVLGTMESHDTDLLNGKAQAQSLQPAVLVCAHGH